jgi:hypothetical protein
MEEPSDTAVTALPATEKVVVRGGEFGEGKARGMVLVPMTTKGSDSAMETWVPENVIGLPGTRVWLPTMTVEPTAPAVTGFGPIVKVATGIVGAT